MTRVEIAVTTLEDALRADAGGADSVEISVDLAADGLTPPLELVSSIKAAVSLVVHAIVRPHNNGFVYSDAQKALILADAEKLVAAGADGIVAGGHLPDGRFDVAFMRDVARAVPNTTFTIHRALDTCTNPLEALQELRGVAQRILVSGGVPDVTAGQHMLKTWVRDFGQDFSFVAAGRVQLETAQALIAYTGAQECHTASAVRTQGEVDIAKVKLLVERLRAE